MEGVCQRLRKLGKVVRVVNCLARGMLYDIYLQTTDI